MKLTIFRFSPHKLLINKAMQKLVTGIYLLIKCYWIDLKLHQIICSHKKYLFTWPMNPTSLWLAIDQRWKTGTMVQCDFWRFWNVYSPKTSKAVFWDVPCINKKAIGVSKYIILWQRFVLICHRKNSTGHQGWSKHNSIWVAPPSFPTLVN